MLALLLVSCLVDPMVLQLTLNTVTRGCVDAGYRPFFFINLALTVTVLGAAVFLIPVEGDWVPTVVTVAVLFVVMAIAIHKACLVKLASGALAAASFFTYKGMIVYLIVSTVTLFGVEIEFVGFPEGWLSDMDLPVALRWFVDNGLWFDFQSGANAP